MAELTYTRTWLYPSASVARIVNAVVGIIEFLLAVRLVLELLGANPGAAFVAWIYSISSNLVAPFQNAFPSLSLSGGSALDFSTVLAMVAYALIGWLIIELFSFVFGRLT